MRKTRAKREDAEYDWLVIWGCVLWGRMERAMVCGQALFFFFLRVLPSHVLALHVPLHVSRFSEN